MTKDRNGLDILDRQECLRLVRTSTIGRVGFVVGDRPTVLPVNFWLDPDDRVLIRTSAGSKLAAAMRHDPIAFEVDDFDAFEHSGWSVVITGTAVAIDPTDVPDAPVPRWAPVGEDAVLAIPTETVTGRRLGRW